MDAEAVKQALRAAHPATQRAAGGRQVPGTWTVLEEWSRMDLFAVSARERPVAPSWVRCGYGYPRVGYEVKTSRGDLRRELLHPDKRGGAVGFCNQFYLAVPKGTLTRDEMIWRPGLDEERPCLWIPADVGLLEVEGSNVVLRRVAPVRSARQPGADVFAGVVRWASARPDPRHTQAA